MKILIDNYSSLTTTEPMYLDTCLNQTQGSVQSILWNTSQVSAFDAIDKVNPDVILLSSVSRSVPDVVKYLKQSAHKIDLVLNTTQLKNEEIEKLESYLTENNVKPLCFIDNSYFSKKSKTKLNTLYPAADLFVNHNVQFYNLQAAILTNSTSNVDLVKEQSSAYETYHKFMLSQETSDEFDKNMSLFEFNKISNNYANVVIVGDIDFVFSQVFFDNLLRSNKVLVKTKDTEKYNKILIDLFNQEETEDISSLLKKQVMKKHTCYNRATRLLRMLKCENAAAILESARESA